MEIKSSDDAIDIKWLDGVKMEESHSMDNDQGGVNGHTWKIILHHMKMEVGYSCGQQHGDRLKCARQMYICRRKANVYLHVISFHRPLVCRDVHARV